MHLASIQPYKSQHEIDVQKYTRKQTHERILFNTPLFQAIITVSFAC